MPEVRIEGCGAVAFTKGGLIDVSGMNGGMIDVVGCIGLVLVEALAEETGGTFPLPCWLVILLIGTADPLP